MKSIFIIHLLLLFAQGNVLVAQESALFAQEDARFEAQVSRDTVLLKALLADGLTYIHSNGLLETKADFIRSVGGGGIVYLSMKAAQRRASFAKKTAIVNGQVDVEGLYQGQNFGMRLFYTAIYQRTSRNSWQLLYWQSTKRP